MTLDPRKGRQEGQRGEETGSQGARESWGDAALLVCRAEEGARSEPCDTLTSAQGDQGGFRPSGLRRMLLCCLKLPSLWSFVPTATGH